jgi:hypothetical protein
MFLSKCIIYIIVYFKKMKKEQMLYIGLGLLVVFVFMLVTMNTRSVSGQSYYGYTFDNALAKTAADSRSNSAMPVRASCAQRKTQEGFLAGTPLTSDTPNWRLEDYLDDPRGANCASKSFGITASGGPLCLTPEQARAMTSRGHNTDESGCLNKFY